jgi:peptidoglycan hydrolase CwlO-like protein
MRLKIYFILLSTCLITLRVKAQEYNLPFNTVIVFDTLNENKKVDKNIENIQLRISQMSNKLMWLQKKIKEETEPNSTQREQFLTELSALIKVRGDLMQTTRRMMRSQNQGEKLVSF